MATARWAFELDDALDLYNAHDDEGCIVHINSVLRDTTPGYPRVRYYVLLASCISDWREAEVRFPLQDLVRSLT